MALSSVQKGNIIESQIANLLMLVSDGALSPSLPIVDDYGVDIVLGTKNSDATIFIQVKSRFVTNSRYRNRLDFQIQKRNFRVSKKLYLLCVYFDQTAGKIDTMWLIPSTKLLSGVVELEKYYRIVASRTENSKDKWSAYKVTPEKLVRKLGEQLI
jgi:hypothetical protein